MVSGHQNHEKELRSIHVSSTGKFSAPNYSFWKRLIIISIISSTLCQSIFAFLGPIRHHKIIPTRGWFMSATSSDTSKEKIETSNHVDASSLNSQEDSSSPNFLSSGNLDSAAWRTASTFGSYLLKRQFEEEENLRRLGYNETERRNLSKQQEAGTENMTLVSKIIRKKQIPKEKEAVIMDREACRELDASVTPLTGPINEDEMEILPLSSLYTALINQTKSILTTDAEDQIKAKRSKLFRSRQVSTDGGTTSIPFTPTKPREIDTGMPLSRPEHYTGRIGRDMRNLAVSIAANINEPWQWRVFCEENGGVLPLLQCVQDGARFIRDKGEEIYDEEDFLMMAREFDESLMVACTASRTLRDLCALSPELSAVITDDILRVDATTDTNNGHSVMEDFVTILRHITDTENIYKRMTSRRSRIKAKFDKVRGRDNRILMDRGNRKEARRRCKLYVLQLLLAMAVTSDVAVQTLRTAPDLTETVLACSSYARIQKTRRWLRYPLEVVKKVFRHSHTRPFISATSISDDLGGKIQGTANQLLAAIGYNQWVPKVPGQKGLRILCLDGGGSRGIVAVASLISLVESMGGIEVCDSFDIIAGTSTGAIIAFLTGLRKESAKLTKQRYNELIAKIFVKSALSTPMLLFTTATYDEAHFTDIMKEVLGDWSMLDSRADPAVPFVFAVSSKMSSTPTHITLFRNYNYASDEFPDPFVMDPNAARTELGLPIPSTSFPNNKSTKREPSMPGLKSGQGSRHPGSFRVLQRIGLRASTAAPTVFKPVSMGGEIYCDGAVVASNPTAIAIHEARTLFPHVPIEMVVSCGTGGFMEEKSNPKFGWDGIIGQIVNSATDSEQVHHVLEDVFGEGGTARLGGRRSTLSKTRYYRLNPVLGMPDDFPIDVTDPELLNEMFGICESYLQEPEQQVKLQEIGDILDGKHWWEKVWHQRRTRKQTAT